MESCVDGEIDFGCTGMGVRGVHSEGTEVADGHGDTVTDDGREVGGCTCNGVAPSPSDDTRRWVKEVERIL